MTRTGRTALVLGGYVAALALASAVAWLHALVMSAVDPDNASGGMAAFGDALLFLGVFGLAAVPPTAAALYFLRAVPAFWSAASLAALAIAATAVPALYGLEAGWTFPPIWLLLAPGFAIAFLLALILAPTRTIRRRFLAATAIELVAFAWFAASLWISANVE